MKNVFGRMIVLVAASVVMHGAAQAQQPDQEAIPPDTYRTPMGLMYAPPPLPPEVPNATIMTAPGGGTGARPAPAGTSTSVPVGWAALPKETKFDAGSWTLSCRGRRWVTYADVQFAGMNLEHEVWSLVRRCGEQVAAGMGVMKIVEAAATGAIAGLSREFGTKLAACLGTEGAKFASSRQLWVRQESDTDWGRC